MAKKDITFKKIGDNYELSRPQWGENKAYISDYPGLLNKVLKHTWTYKKGNHPYLSTNIKSTDGKKHPVYLHKFVLNHLYGTENLDEMLKPDNIIEHLDNNGLNCSYDNLHILSADNNKAKAFKIDKAPIPSFTTVQTFVTGVYYSHKKKYYQVQMVFNRDALYHKLDEKIIPIECVYLFYYDFDQLYIDWLNIMKFKKADKFDFGVLRPNKSAFQDRPQLELTEEEKKGSIVVRNGVPYLLLKTEGDDGLAFIVKTAYRNLEQID